MCDKFKETMKKVYERNIADSKMMIALAEKWNDKELAARAKNDLHTWEIN